MVDTHNRKGHPTLSPPQGELPQKSTNPLVVFLILVSLLTLLVLSAIVIWLLPPKSPPLLEQQSPTQIPVMSTMGDDSSPVAHESRKTEQLLEVWLKAQARAEAENIQVWGEEEYAAIQNLVAQGDQFYRSGEFVSAQSLYKEATDSLELLFASKDDKLKSTLIQGEQALENGASQKALVSFQQALQIDQENEDALSGMRRARTLDHVLLLYQKGLRLETENKLEQAQQLFRDASQIDHDFLPTAEALKRVEKKRQDVLFQKSMSHAIEALNNGQLNVADNALEKAAQLRPQDTAMADARQRVCAMRMIQQLKKLQIRADAFMDAENWEGVVKTYGQALQLDTNVGFASIGVAEAQKRFQLDKALKSILARPDRLQDEGPLHEARAVLLNAQQIESPGTLLQSQIRTLTTLVENALTTVDVLFRSDNATEIEIYHVGRFYPFFEKQITIKPGTYTIVGRKAGFKDVRMSIKINVAMKMPVFFIRCEERI